VKQHLFLKMFLTPHKGRYFRAGPPAWRAGFKIWFCFHLCSPCMTSGQPFSIAGEFREVIAPAPQLLSISSEKFLDFFHRHNLSDAVIDIGLVIHKLAYAATNRNSNKNNRFRVNSNSYHFNRAVLAIHELSSFDTLTK